MSRKWWQTTFDFSAKLPEANDVHDDSPRTSGSQEGVTPADAHGDGPPAEANPRGLGKPTSKHETSGQPTPVGSLGNGHRGADNFIGRFKPHRGTFADRVTRRSLFDLAEAPPPEPDNGSTITSQPDPARGNGDPTPLSPCTDAALPPSAGSSACHQATEEDDMRCAATMELSLAPSPAPKLQHDFASGESRSYVPVHSDEIAVSHLVHTKRRRFSELPSSVPVPTRRRGVPARACLAFS